MSKASMFLFVVGLLLVPSASAACTWVEFNNNGVLQCQYGSTTVHHVDYQNSLYTDGSEVEILKVKNSANEVLCNTAFVYCPDGYEDCEAWSHWLSTATTQGIYYNGQYDGNLVCYNMSPWCEEQNACDY